MTTTTAPSAYPFDLSALLPRAQEIASSLGKVPSRNQLMKELKVGAPKATALREALQAAEFTAAPAAPPVLPDVLADSEPTTVEPVPEVVEMPPPAEPVAEVAPLLTGDGHPDATSDPEPILIPHVRVPRKVRKARSWPVMLLALPAFVAIWSGWVGLGELTGFGVVHPLPGIWSDLSLNTAITLPIGVETYAAYALAVWLTGTAPAAARRFARWSAIGSLVFGGAGQVAYHLLTAAGITHAPWQITTAVACLPVAVLGMGAALAHLIHAHHE
ncbi:ABC transporter permease [Dactylosporangium vinaceum]|uniref:ABC transporter permease n=1 Tax=Dactylosporangium vinaceum TaxID=53362 RepID=A0ABV5MHT7_9ACTN|nr:ABC transporter permease [Dactylosporangium vinaceum]UAB94899.1 ABC transporter permease [Dactylosporangium vinaceum]